MGLYHDDGTPIENPRYRPSKKAFARKVATGRYHMTIYVKNGRAVFADLLYRTGPEG